MKLPFTLHQLKILTTIATEKNLTNASKLLFISQPSLSKHLKKLQSNLKNILIYKNKEDIILTDHGKLFLKYSKKILSLCEESCRALNNFQINQKRKLTLGASHASGLFLMPKILALFAKKYPEITLNLKVSTIQTISNHVANSSIDFAIIDEKCLPNLNQSLFYHHFIADELLLVISRFHTFSTQDLTNVNKEEIYKLEFIALTSISNFKSIIDKALFKHQIQIEKLNIIFQLNSIEALKIAVSLGLGVTFVFSTAIEKELTLGLIQKIKVTNLNIINILSLITHSNYSKTKFSNFFYSHFFTLMRKKSFTYINDLKSLTY